jgi:formamidopyrimidine-DNA glycosylase
VLGGGGERIIYHESAATIPAKYQFLLSFTDDTHLSVTVQMWGSMRLYERGAERDVEFIGPVRIGPLDDAFTPVYFDALFDGLAPEDKAAIKFFIISKPGIWGLGNGYLQDILLKARLHPRRRAVSLTAAERAALYGAIREVRGAAGAAGGRDDELGLFGQPGGYSRLLSSRAAGAPCPQCGGGPVEKIQFLGGASYFCPECQRQA